MTRHRPLESPTAGLPRRVWLLALVAGCALLASCKSRVEAPAAPHSTRVLFIGNSYTYYNNLPRVLEALAASASPPERLETRGVLEGGARLQTHWDDGKAMAALREGGWSHVVLQEQSTLGLLMVDGWHQINDPERILFPYARRFHDEVKKQGAKTVLALTWARKSTPEAQVRLNHAFLSLGRELGATVTPMGLAWQRVHEQHPDIVLYKEDGSHPTPAGTYLAACTLYATLFGRSPEGLTSHVRGVDLPEGQPEGGEMVLIDLPEPTARILQQAAWQAVQALDARGNASDAPPPRTLPSLPSGTSVRWDALPGTWTGELRFYAEDRGRSPAQLRLELARSGEEYTGVLHITFPKGNGEGPFPVRAERTPAGTLRFTVPFAADVSNPVRYEAVMDGDGKLLGTAVYEDASTLDRILGSWTLAPAR